MSAPDATDPIYFHTIIFRFNSEGMGLEVVGWKQTRGVTENIPIDLNTMIGLYTVPTICRLIESMKKDGEGMHKFYCQLADDLLEVGLRKVAGKHPEYLKKVSIHSLMMYFTFKLLRELEKDCSAAVLHNIATTIGPYNGQFRFLTEMGNKNFREIVLDNFGNAGPKLMRAVGSRFIIGTEGRICRIDESISDDQIARVLKADSTINHARETDTIVKDYDPVKRELVIMGSRHLNTGLIYIGRMLRDTLPLDKIREVIEEPKSALDSSHTSPRGAVNIDPMVFYQSVVWMKKTFLSDQTFMLLLKELDMGHIRDCANQLFEFYEASKIPAKLKEYWPDGLRPPKRWKTGKEFHDKISKDYNDIKCETDNKQINYELPVMTLDGWEKDGLRMVVPKETKELVHWGKILSICVGSYAERAVRHESYLVCIYKGEDPAFMLHYDLDQIDHDGVPVFKEFKAKSNDAVPVDETKTIRSIMQEWYQQYQKEKVNVKPENLGDRTSCANFGDNMLGQIV
jgi:hypothetical protein